MKKKIALVLVLCLREAFLAGQPVSWENALQKMRN